MDRNTVSLTGYMVAITAVIALLVVSLVVTHRESNAVIDEQTDRVRASMRAAANERGSLVVERVARLPAGLDPHGPEWASAPAIELPLQPQTMAMPKLEQVSVNTATLQGLTDGRFIAWRVSWADPTADMNVDVDVQCDAVALQFPLGRRAPFTMGGRGEPVQILHWKALWQKDIDEHFQDVQDLHPNYWADLYWFAGGTAPQRVPDDFGDPRSHTWFVAYQAGNPMADFERKLPVEELAAIGFGTLTPQAESLTTGRGVWSDGSWHVVFVRPAQTSDAMDYQFWAGDRGSVGVAVWDGAGGNVGGRKHWTNWTDFTVSH